MDKKGLVTSVLVTFLLSVIALLILIIFIFYTYRPFVIDTIDDFQCKMSVILKSYTRTVPVVGQAPIVSDIIPEVSSPVPLRCKAHDKEVKNKESAKKTIAKEMANCWERFGEGKYDFYSDIQYAWTTSNMCYICAKISSNTNVNIPSQEMIQYLRDNKVRPLIDKRTYEQYITGTGFEEGKFLDGIGNIEIKPDRALYILYMVNKDEGILSRVQRGFLTPLSIIGLDFLFRREKSALVDATKLAKKQTTSTVVPYTAVDPRTGRQVTTFSVGEQTVKTGIKGRFALLGKANLYFLGATALGGVANAVLQSKGFNTNIFVVDSDGAIGLCSSYAE